MASAPHDLRPFRTERRRRLSTEGAAKRSDAANETQQAARLGTTDSRREWGVGGGADGGAKSSLKAVWNLIGKFIGTLWTFDCEGAF